MPIPLTALALDSCARVVEITADTPLRRRLRELGLVADATVTALFRNISGDPTAYAIRGAVIALRSCDAGCVLVAPLDEAGR